MHEHAAANQLPEWIANLSDEEKRKLIEQISDSIQSPAPAAGPNEASAPRKVETGKKPRSKRTTGAASIPEHIQKYIRPRREKTDLRHLYASRGTQGRIGNGLTN